MKTINSRAQDVKRSWYILDASEASLGRLATASAQLLSGKGKANYSPHVDGGDFVIVVNAAKLKVSGQKLNRKQYYRHSGYPSGLSTRSLSDQLALDPSKVIGQAVKGMLPANKLRPGRLHRLKVYSGSEHHHQAQNPTSFQLTPQKGTK